CCCTATERPASTTTSTTGRRTRSGRRPPTRSPSTGARWRRRSWAPRSRCTCSPRWSRHWSRTAPDARSTCELTPHPRAVRDTGGMADELPMNPFFPEVFRHGVPDIQPALHALLERERVYRGEDGHVTILHLDDVLEVTKRRDVHSMDPEMVELAGAYM